MGFYWILLNLVRFSLVWFLEVLIAKFEVFTNWNFRSGKILEIVAFLICLFLDLRRECFGFHQCLAAGLKSVVVAGPGADEILEP